MSARHGHVPTRREVARMRGNELSQAIPPAYTEYIGRQLLDHLAEAA